MSKTIYVVDVTENLFDCINDYTNGRKSLPFNSYDEAIEYIWDFYGNVSYSCDHYENEFGQEVFEFEGDDENAKCRYEMAWLKVYPTVFAHL